MNLLAIDIGNSQTVLGLFRGERLFRCWRTPSNQAGFRRLAGRMTFPVDRIVVAGVVPPMNREIDRLGRALSTKPLRVGAELKMPIRIRVKEPRKVGADRIANAVAAYARYRLPLLVIDFGTATTFDVVTREGDFIGGLIAPGIGTMNDSLAERCVLLPRLPVRRPKELVGRTTSSAIQAGVFYGTLGLAEGIVGRLREKTGPDLKVIATGGWSRLLAPSLTMIDEVDPLLTLKGLHLLGVLNPQS